MAVFETQQNIKRVKVKTVNNRLGLDVSNISADPEFCE